MRMFQERCWKNGGRDDIWLKWKMKQVVLEKDEERWIRLKWVSFGGSISNMVLKLGFWENALWGSQSYRGLALWVILEKMVDILEKPFESFQGLSVILEDIG